MGNLHETLLPTKTTIWNFTIFSNDSQKPNHMLTLTILTARLAQRKHTTGPTTWCLKAKNYNRDKLFCIYLSPVCIYISFVNIAPKNSPFLSFIPAGKDLSLQIGTALHAKVHYRAQN